MKNRFMFIGLLFLGGLFPGQGSEAKKYYPENPDMTWEYKITSDKAKARKLKITNLAQWTFLDKNVTPRKWESEGATNYTFAAEDKSGVYQVAAQKPGESEPKQIQPPIYYLKTPIRAETTWDIVQNLGQVDMKLTLTITGLQEKVTVPAGTFQECLRLKESGKSLKALADGATATMESENWYAPHVGWVKGVTTINKKMGDKVVFSEVITYELESFKQSATSGGTQSPF